MRWLIIIMMLALLPVVSAGEVYELGSFAAEPTQGIVLTEKDALRFDLLDGRHQLYLDEVGRSGFIKVNIFPYIDLNTGSNSWSATLRIGRVLKADLDQDDVDDLMVRVSETDEEKKTATIIVTSIEDQYGKKEGFSDTAIETQPDEEELDWSKLRPYLFIGGIVVALILVIIFRKRSKKEKPKEEKKPAAKKKK
ncbi:MAG: hypothetical protein ABIB71_01440 [Candidatus Woesearchaeota archaeon]